MNNLTKIILYSIISIFYMSCGFNSLDINKVDNSIEIYKNNNLIKKYALNDSHQILDIHNFDDGILSSHWQSNKFELKDSIEYYGNGQIKTKGYLLSGLKHSLWTYYDREGHLLVERYFSYGEPSNIWIWYNLDDRSVKKFETYPDFRDNGKLIRYFRSGKLKEIKSYINGKLNGPYALYENSIKNNIIESSFYKMGQKSFE